MKKHMGTTMGREEHGTTQNLLQDSYWAVRIIPYCHGFHGLWAVGTIDFL